MMPDVAESVLIDLRAIRQTFELRWNPRAVKSAPGHIDATGVVHASPYDPRWELWDTDPQGKHYRVMSLQTEEGAFRQPGNWLVEEMRFWNPERFDGDLNELVHQAIDEPNRLKEVGTEADSDDLLEMVGKWAEWCTTPKRRVLKSMPEIAAEHAAWQAARARTSAVTAGESA